MGDLAGPGSRVSCAGCSVPLADCFVPRSVTGGRAAGFQKRPHFGSFRLLGFHRGELVPVLVSQTIPFTVFDFGLAIIELFRFVGPSDDFEGPLGSFEMWGLRGQSCVFNVLNHGF